MFWTILGTVISGTLVYILGQIIKEYILNPELEFKKTLAGIDNKLKFYSDVITNPGNILPQEIKIKCSTELRNLSCDLEVTYKQLILIKRTRELDKKIADAAKKLIFLSNNVYHSGDGVKNSDEIDSIRDLLKITKLN